MNVDKKGISENWITRPETWEPSYRWYQGRHTQDPQGGTTDPRHGALTVGPGILDAIISETRDPEQCLLLNLEPKNYGLNALEIGYE